MLFASVRVQELRAIMEIGLSTGGWYFISNCSRYCVHVEAKKNCMKPEGLDCYM